MSRSLSIQEDKDLDTFCQLEEALREEEKANGENDYPHESLAFEFPDSFVNPDGKTIDENAALSRNERNDFHETFVELQQHLADVKRREADLLRDENWVKSEKKELEKERRKLETDKMIVAEKLGNAELADLREKYEELLQQYEKEKAEWENEKKAMTEKIAQLEKRARPKVTFITPNFTKNDKPANDPHNDNQADHHEASASSQNSSAQMPPPGSPTQQSVAQQQHEKQMEQMTLSTRPIIQTQAQEPQANEPVQPILAPESPKSGKKRKPRIYKINVHDNYSLDFDYNPGPAFKEEQKKDGRKIVRYKDGSLGTVFRNGTRKIKRCNTTYIFYSNGDTGIEYQDGAVGYRYKETQAIELTLPDKSVIYIFKNGQKEKHYSNGDKAIQFPNGVYKIVHASGDTETHYPDGKVESIVNGTASVSYDYQD